MVLDIFGTSSMAVIGVIWVKERVPDDKSLNLKKRTMLKDRPIFGHLVGDYSKTVNVIAPKFHTVL